MSRLLRRFGWFLRWVWVGLPIREAAEREARFRILKANESHDVAPQHVVERIKQRWVNAERMKMRRVK